MSNARFQKHEQTNDPRATRVARNHCAQALRANSLLAVFFAGITTCGSLFAQWEEITDGLIPILPRPPASGSINFQSLMIEAAGSDLHLSASGYFFSSEDGGENFTPENLADPESEDFLDGRLLNISGGYLWATSIDDDFSTSPSSFEQRLHRKTLPNGTWQDTSDGLILTLEEDVNSFPPEVVDVAYESSTGDFYVLIYYYPDTTNFWDLRPLTEESNIQLPDSMVHLSLRGRYIPNLNDDSSNAPPGFGDFPGIIPIDPPPSPPPLPPPDEDDLQRTEVWRLSAGQSTWSKVESIELINERGRSINVIDGTVFITLQKFEGGRYISTESTYREWLDLVEFGPDGSNASSDIGSPSSEPAVTVGNRIVFFDNHENFPRGSLTSGTSISDSEATEFPVNIYRLKEFGGTVFAAGFVAPIHDQFPENAGLLYSANAGLTWDELDMTGIDVEEFIIHANGSTPLSGVIYGGYTSAVNFTIGAEYAFLYTNNLRLFRRPVEELDLRATTRIVSQPQHAVRDLGEPLTLSVDAIGTGDLVYTWYKDGAILPDENGSYLSISALSLSDVGNYSVTVTGDRGAATSRLARVGIRERFASFAAASYPEGKRGLLDDGNGDGIANFRDYIFLGPDGQSPTIQSITMQTGREIGWPLEAEDRYMTITVRRRVTATDYIVLPQFGRSLEELSNAPLDPVLVGESILDGEMETQTYRAPVTMEDSSSGFMSILLE